MKSLIHFFHNITFSKKLLLILTPLLSVIISMKTALLGLCLLIIFDLITGIRKTLHKKNICFNPFKTVFWKSIKSYLLRETWKKAYEYGIGILIIVIFESLILGVTPISLGDRVFTIAELSILIPGAIEVWSIFENFEAVSGRNILKVVKKLLPTSLSQIFVSEQNKI